MMDGTDKPAGDPTPPAVYSNYFQVGHNAVEFLFDFGQHYADAAPRMHTRVVMSPIYARALSETIDESLERYEAVYGPIPDTPDGSDDDG
jgi:hypothetical protein